jgi:histone H1/5
MVANAISSLKERGGSMLQAIKKYIIANYKVDSEKLSPLIKKYLKTTAASGEMVLTKGKGATGSFKLAATKTEKPSASAAPHRGRGGASTGQREKKQRGAKGKAKSQQKVAVKKTCEKKQASPAKLKKSPSKAKKAVKVPTKKPMAPRPKTAVKAKALKKAARKKK